MNNNFHIPIKEERIVYSYDDTPNDNESDSDTSKADPRDADNKSKKKYSVIPQAVREKFIKRVLSKEVTIKEAAKEFGLKFSTSKAILQTYKKEGRIGKKKNRERKTKVVNVVFVCNINPVNPYASNIFPIVSVNELKGAKATTNAEENKAKLVEQTLLNYPEHKIVHQTHLQIPNDSNKTTQQFIKELGNEFLKDYIEKNFNPSKISSVGPLNNTMTSLPNTSTMMQNPTHASMPNTSTINSMNINLNGLTSMPPPHMNNMSNMSNMPNMGSSYELPSMMGQGYLNHVGYNQMNPSVSMNQKRSFQNYDTRDIPDLEMKNEQINDISVKKFKSGDDTLWDYDMDRSKKDLEDFIYKTHNAIKNNSYMGKTVTFDFSKYKDDFNE